MSLLCKRFIPLFLLLIACSLIEAGITTEYADARSMGGGKMFKRTMPKKAPARQSVNPGTTKKSGSSLSRGLMGGFLGGALGGLLFGSMFGAAGSGMGILPLLILGGLGFYFFKKMQRPQKSGYQSGFPPPRQDTDFFSGNASAPPATAPPAPPGSEAYIAEGVEQIRATDPGFDPSYFTEVASDVFFQVQAGWMRRDLAVYRHLLGDQLAQEYEAQFAEMARLGHINKLESIAVRSIKVIDGGSDGVEDFVTVLFTANLLDYTVDEKSGDLVEGSMTEPVKFTEEWTWARPVGTEEWKLENIKVV